VKEGKVSTPPLNSGCLAGVSRSILLDEAPKAGLPISERVLYLDDFYTADEVFITSTTRHVQPISHIEKHAIKLAPGPVTEKLEKLFDNYVREYIGRATAAVR
jgi:branched-chain amino acid aminotransferase